jgi:hypothetical protein
MTSSPSDSLAPGLDRERRAVTSTADSAPEEGGAIATYFGRVREFQRVDWLVYVLWVGLMLGLTSSTGGFLLIGHTHGVRFPAEAWMLPTGAAIFTLAIAVDTIGHRTAYKEVIARAEGLVHGVTIFCGIGSCVLLCAAYAHRDVFWVPAMVLTVMSIVYSLIDEAFHWHRYWTKKSDPVEMWSHLGIFVGHGIMMLGWWRWFFLGYPGVAATLRAFVPG